MSVAPAAYTAINDAYYEELVKAPAAARSRAQAGYTIAAAIATALVTAGVLTDFEERPHQVRRTLRGRRMDDHRAHLHVGCERWRAGSEVW